ncbi:xanthine dehydrogenase accessory protein XdhC [Snodgrassella sp. CFCC 13594]|uniref:xanthine dehydrogenase accessory protein XdhC n=1 Tax=Snodgrassella sp. CFCC 13594 TaxID=1775559 RepID=UPI00082ADF66|nr:xanthine dehydrogenase accessory protein XdhC [Snodgrassella sp. CFCC 13594]
MQWWRELVRLPETACGAVLVTVARVEGSAPREMGSSLLMWLDAQSNVHQVDTIGGGHLEWVAVAKAKQMLTDGHTSCQDLQRYSLAASLGQCCGGVMWLLYERLSVSASARTARQIAWQRWQADLPVWRVCQTGMSSRWLPENDANEVGLCQENSQFAYRQRLPAPGLPVWLFGAGHVGEALVRALLPLDMSITWLDNREEVFPADLMGQIRMVHCDVPEDELCLAPHQACILVLTHDHQLDFRIVRTALMRPRPFAFVGMIGSRTKRASFVRRLQERGVTADELAHLVCPIGLAGIRDKRPAAIAAAVAAQLLMKQAAR